jgi:vanillate O-demethylase ferredoxin subunit
MTQAETLRLRVVEIEPLTDRVHRLRLAACDGASLPAAAPGAHIELELQGEDGALLHRAYSVVNPASSEQHYEIAVQREDRGSGGSLQVHRLHVGAIVPVRAPVNDFPLAAEAARSVLIAGGIGITPILAMARHLQATKQAWRLDYLSRDRASAAYADAVEASGRARLWHDGGEAGKGPNLRELLGPHEVGTHLYVCGPKGLIGAVVETARALGWPEDAVHYELFTGALEQQGDRAFRVTVAGSGVSCEVRPGQSILEVLEQAGVPILSDCRRGECGVCMTQVISGAPDHRDSSLTESERAAGNVMCPCVSRSLSSELVLQL